MKIEMDMPEINGFEYTGEHRLPTRCEHFLNMANEVTKANGAQVYERPILRKKRWRAEIYESYFIIGRHIELIMVIETNNNYDKILWNCGNYFQTEALAKEARKKILEVLK